MHAKDLLINQGGNGKAIETVSECLPQFDVVSAFTFIIEPIYTVDGSALVIASKEEKVLRILNLVS